jgi:chaperone BCS1
MDLSSEMSLPSKGKAVETYKKAVTLAATAAAYTVMAREILPDEVRDTVRWAASVVRDHLLRRPKQRRLKAIYVSQEADDGSRNRFYSDARAYLDTRIDPHAMSELRLDVRGARRRLSMVPGDSMTDVFEGVEFKWTSTCRSRRRRGRDGNSDEDDDDRHEPGTLVLCFDAEHTDLALNRYVPFITETLEQERRLQSAIVIAMNLGSYWKGITHHHPATFDTLAMDPDLKRSIIADLDRFLKRKEYYRRIGKAWKRGYLLYGPPGTGKSSLVAAMANYLRFNLYDLDLSEVCSNTALQRLLLGMDNKSILVIEDIDCCFSAASREESLDDAGSDSSSDSDKVRCA